MANEWHINRDGKQQGPVSSARLQQLATIGWLRPADLVWKDGMDHWIAASTIRGLVKATPADGPPGNQSSCQTPPQNPWEQVCLEPTDTPAPRRPSSSKSGVKIALVAGIVVLVFIAGLVIGSRPWAGGGPAQPERGQVPFTTNNARQLRADHIITQDTCLYTYEMGDLGRDGELWTRLMNQKHDPLAWKGQEHVVTLSKGTGLQVLKTDFVKSNISADMVHFVRVRDGRHKAKSVRKK